MMPVLRSRKAPIRVFHLIETLGPWGAQQQLLTSVRALDSRVVTSFVGSLFEPLELRGAFEDSGATVVPLNLRGTYDWRRGIFALARELKSLRIDLVHTHLIFANLYGRLAARAAGVSAVVTTLHSPDYSYQDNGKWRFKLGKWIDRISVRNINAATVAVSSAVRADYARHLGLKDIEVLPNAVDLAQYRGDWRPLRRSQRAQLGYREDDFVLGSIGRLHREKGQHTLLRALATIQESVPHVKLVLVGAGAELENLRALARQKGVLDLVHFAGQQVDVRPFLAMADLFVLPSNLEGMPVSLLEAMAMGLPSVATRVGGTPEVLQNGATGLLVEPASVEPLAEAVIRLAHDPQERAAMSACALNVVQERFSAVQHGARLQALYEDLLGHVELHQPVPQEALA